MENETSRENRQRREERKKNRKKRNIRAAIIVTIEIAVLVGCIIFQASVISKRHAAQNAENLTNASAAAEEPSEAASQESSDKASASLAIDTFIAPDIADDGKTDGVDSGSVYVWNKNAFELFYGSDSAAERYAELMNKAGKELPDNVNVYSAIVPNHTEMGLPERLKNTDNGAQTSSQAEYIKAAYSYMDSSVTPVNVYNAISSHCDEYVYFHSDHHWSGLGAYYAYTAFAETLDLPVLDLGECEENVIDGFTGTLMKLTSAEVEKDSVHYWKFPYEVTDAITDDSGSTNYYDSCYYSDAAGGDYTYGVFLMGDNPLEVITSESEKANGKIAVIHESYGNAFVPYLTYDFSEVYSIDFRSWYGDLSEFCAEHEIDNVLFINGVMSSATQVQLDSIEAIL